MLMIYIYILDGNGRLNDKFSFRMLKIKTNWLSEYTKIKKSIPESWQQKCCNEESSKTKVNINKINIQIYSEW